jgi:hypothetical protein
MGGVPQATEYIWKYPCSITFRRYAIELPSNYHHQAQNRFQRGDFVEHLHIEIIQFWSVQSTPQTLINLHCHLLAEWLSLLKVMCWLNRMPWISLFWVFVMLVVQSSCIAICFPPGIFHSNYLPMSPCLCWIRNTSQIRLLGVYRFVFGSIFRWWCTMYIVYE